MIKIIQICFDEESKANCFNHENVEVFFNEENPHPYFENKIIADKVPNIEADYIGVFSHAFKKKRKKDIDFIIRKINKNPVYSFFSNIKDKNVISHMESLHTGSKEILNYICLRIGLTPSNKLAPIYQNHFIARKEIYNDYVTYLTHAIDLMNNDKWLIDRCNKPAMRTGKYATYTLHTFVLERLFSVYCKNKNIKIEMI
jgi:hypothetical protein